LSKNIRIKIYRTIILPVVLYGCETWSLTLWEEHRLRVFENRVLRGIFGPKRNGVTGEWRRLRNGINLGRFSYVVFLVYTWVLELVFLRVLGFSPFACQYYFTNAPYSSLSYQKDKRAEPGNLQTKRLFYIKKRRREKYFQAFFLTLMNPVTHSRGKDMC
jgi:hypothetical protein